MASLEKGAGVKDCIFGLCGLVGVGQYLWIIGCPLAK